MSVFCAAAQKDSVVHTIGINARPSYIMPTHGYYNGYNPIGKPLRAGGSAHLNYAFEYSHDSRQGVIYPGAYQGVGLGIQTFLAEGTLGNPVSLYLFQGAPFCRFSDRLSLGYEWNFGISGGWKPDEYLLTATVHNIYINVGILMSWKIGRFWELQAGPEFTHYSNGDTRFPNGGANTINFRVGVRRHFSEFAKTVAPKIFNVEDSLSEFWGNVTYDLIAFGAWRADRIIIDGNLHLIDDSFLVAGLQLNPLYHLNHSLSFGPSLDLIYDRSANQSSPQFLNQAAAGISARAELRMPVFAVNIGAGYNFSRKGSELRGFYGTFILKSFVTESLFLNVGYRLSSVLYSHNLMFGLGWRFHKK